MNNKKDKMDPEEKLHKEIDLIQSIITRMANNSFMIKGWTITVIVATFAFLSTKEDSYWVNPIILLIILLISIIVFWYLDAFFLQTERKYRALYNRVIKKRAEGNTENYYDLTPPQFMDGTNNPTTQNGKKNKKIPNILQIMVSKTLLPFFLIFLGFVLSYIFYSCNKEQQQNNISLNKVSHEIISINKKIDIIDTKIEQLAVTADLYYNNIENTKKILLNTKEKLEKKQKQIDKLLSSIEEQTLSTLPSASVPTEGVIENTTDN